MPCYYIRFPNIQGNHMRNDNGTMIVVVNITWLQQLQNYGCGKHVMFIQTSTEVFNVFKLVEIKVKKNCDIWGEHNIVITIM